jgi:ketosteroid isomerase-like protein
MLKRKKMAAYVLVLVAVTSTATRSRGQEKPADEAMKLATKLTEEGAATFSKADAKAMAAYYTENAIIFLQSKNDEGPTVKEYDGKAEIERAYADFFKGEHGTIQAKNTVEYARLLAPDLLVIAGTFEPNQLAAKPLKVPFYQVRVKEGDKWLINSVRIFVLPQKN